MNMSVLPIANSQADGQSTSKSKNTGDNYTFANAIEHSRQNPDKNRFNSQALSHGNKNTKTNQTADKNTDPEQTLTLIIDTIALPLLKGKTAINQMPGQLNNAQAKINLAGDKSKSENTAKDNIKFKKTDIQWAIESTGKKARPDQLLGLQNLANTNNNDQGNKKWQINIGKDKLQNKTNDFKKDVIKTDLKADTEFNLASKKPANSKEILTLNSQPRNFTINPDFNAQATTDPSINSGFSSQLEPNINNLTGVNNRQIVLHTNFGSPNWAHDFNNQVVNAGQNSLNLGHTITMQLNPPELGPVQISLHVNDGITQALFVSPHANVRHAIENALPNLQDQMDQAGISLGQTTVSDHSEPQQDFEQNHQQASNTTFRLDINQVNQNSSEPGPVQQHISRPRPDALIDTFV